MWSSAYRLISLLLPLQVGLVDGKLDPDVQLSQRHLDAELGVAADDLNLLVQSRRAVGNQVSLHADAVDPDAVGLEHLDDTPGCLALGADALQVVVVVVELRVRVDLGRRAERQLDVVFTEHLVKHRLAPCAVVLERLVDDVPGVAAALPMARNVCNVADNYLLELLGCPLGSFDPGGQLAVPDEGVAAEELAVLLGDGGDDLALGVVEDAGLGLGEEPLDVMLVDSGGTRRNW